ncbi:MAG: hypothetical protein ACYTEQ_28340, partial [Planctomycetota bacterium]
HRYATKLEKGKSKVNGLDNEVFLVKSRKAAELAIKYGIIETSILFVYQRIIRALADIIPSGLGGSNFSYGSDPNELSMFRRITRKIAGTEDFAAMLQAERALGGDMLAFQRGDELAVGMGSSVPVIQMMGGKLNYQAFPRHRVWVAFHPVINEDGVDRPTNTMELDEASAAVVEIGTTDLASKDRTFAAWLPASDKWDNGRFVRWTGGDWDSIPDPSEGDPNIMDYRNSAGEIANPLTEWKQKVDYSSPEIPLVPWYGSSIGWGTDILPIDSQIYTQDKEINVASSRLLMSSLKSARGVFAFTKDKAASNVVQEIMDEGPVVMHKGQELDVKGVAAVNSLQAFDVLARIAASVSEGRGVPAYMTRVEGSADFPSGEALRQANEPLTKTLTMRTEINRAGVRRKYQLERAYAGMSWGKEQGKGIVEHWQPPLKQFAETPEQILARGKEELAMKIADHVEIAKRLYNFNSRDEAMAYLETLTQEEEAENEAGAAGDITNLFNIQPDEEEEAQQ